MSELDPALLAVEVQRATVVRYVVNAGFAALIYDMLITLDVEIRLIWPAKLSAVKILFLVNRYFVPAVYIWNEYMASGSLNSVSNEMYEPECFRWLLSVSMLQGLAMNVVGAALIVIRVRALYANNDRVLRLLLILYACTLVILPALVLVSKIENRAGFVFIPAARICYEPRASWIWAIWVPGLAFETVVVVLIARKTLQHMRKEGSTPLMTLLLRDGLMYYMVVLPVELFNLIAMCILPGPYWLVGLQAGWCLSTIMVSRLYLNLRSVGTHAQWKVTTATATRKADLPPSTHPQTNTTWSSTLGEEEAAGREGSEDEEGDEEDGISMHSMSGDGPRT